MIHTTSVKEQMISSLNCPQRFESSMISVEPILESWSMHEKWNSVGLVW